MIGPIRGPFGWGPLPQGGGGRGLTHPPPVWPLPQPPVCPQLPPPMGCGRGRGLTHEPPVCPLPQPPVCPQLPPPMGCGSGRGLTHPPLPHPLLQACAQGFQGFVQELPQGEGLDPPPHGAGAGNV